MKTKAILFTSVVGLVGLVGMPAYATGTPSGTTVTNTATLDYQVAGVAQTQVTASATFVMDTKVDLTVTNNAGATVAPGATNRVLAYTLTNTGNATQGYSLTAVQAAGATVTMTNVRIYRDVNANGAYDSGTDTLYTAGQNVGDLAADASVRLLIVADTPIGASNGQTASWYLVARTLDAGTTTATTQSAGADNKDTVQIVFADGDGDGAAANDTTRDGIHSAAGVFTVSSATLGVNKTSTVVSDPVNGTTNPMRMPGARIRYTIAASNTGGAAATSVVITDAIPANTTYVPGSITVDAVTMTDANDGDVANYNVSVAGAVRVNVGTIATGATSTVTFDVTLQ